MIIYGAGLAGLLAGCQFQNAQILEASPAQTSQHKAVLRFRSKAVGDAVGIDFRRVTVRKGLWMNGRQVAPSIQLANWYSQKVVGSLQDRSIWNLETCDRWTAPEDFIEQLTDRCSSRIAWNCPVTTAPSEPGQTIISTLPMPVMVKLTSGTEAAPEFRSSPITVRRWRIAGADVFQTVYFPAVDTPLYRASITGDLLIAEYVGARGISGDPSEDLTTAFGLSKHQCEPLDTAQQRFGKILPIDDGWRKQFIFELTHRHNIFSLGRFATWRNILLDDVIGDIAVLKKLMAGTTYDRARHNAK